MLGKQGWRIMTNPDTLIARIYKAKYFPRCNFLESSLGHNPSFVWRSLCNAKFILKAGSRWKIGDGTTIPVWNNYWMKDNVTLYPLEDVASTLANLRVSDCLSPNNKSWNLPFLQSIFNNQIVEHIVNTPLYPSVREDRLIWRKENDGEYSVRSAYRLCMNELLDTSHFKVQGEWSLIWKLKVPPKIKNLVWRICRKCLPTRVRLRDKGVSCDDVCSLCNTNEEDSLHLLFRCQSSMNVWDRWSAFPTVSNIFTQNQDVSSIIFMCLQLLTSDEAALFCYVIWSIWKQRNNKIWNGVTDPQAFVFDRAKSMLEDWKIARAIRENSPNHNQPDRNVKWVKPRAGHFKCNIDASFSQNSNMVGIGMCIRDEHGAFVLARTECFSPMCEVHVGEALGLLSALEWVHLLNLGHVDFELDAKRVVDSFKSQNSDATEFGNIINNCKTLLSNLYENSSVEFVRRQANEVAHNLAKAALLSASSQLLVTIPHCIEHILINEMQ
jgi:ribonuclease HI